MDTLSFFFFLEKLSQAVRGLYEFLTDYLYFYFSDEGTNAQRDTVTCPGSHSMFLGGLLLRVLLLGTGSQQPWL